MERLAVRGLRARGNFVIDVVLGVDRGPAATADGPAPALDSGLICEQVVAFVEERPVDLAETLAQQLADMSLSHPAVREVEVTVRGPGVAGEPHSGDVTVTITRRPEQRSAVAAYPRTSACVW
ncbi:dihydroneopterin aldolase [Streptomyces sp. NPDC032472]|uniref:dihydroneopterin aldolase n=1 Tax=Streptomyces sp. NPDC032472 TaxID=3155018 RepID=UPI0033E4CC28